MSVIQPWSARAREGADLRNLLVAAVGESLSAVRYVVPRGASWPEGHRDNRAHEVDMAVELVMLSGAVLVLSWAMDGPKEGLAIELREPGDLDSNLPGDAVDVSSHVDWSGLLGESIINVTPAWHVPNEGCPEMPWAFRVEFSNTSGLVVALGEAEGSGFTYMPDALVVIFDTRLAASYKIPASATSSCG